MSALALLACDPALNAGTGPHPACACGRSATPRLVFTEKDVRQLWDAARDADSVAVGEFGGPHDERIDNFPAPEEWKP
jgi:hypothetical protein